MRRTPSLLRRTRSREKYRLWHTTFTIRFLQRSNVKWTALWDGEPGVTAGEGALAHSGGLALQRRNPDHPKILYVLLRDSEPSKTTEALPYAGEGLNTRREGSPPGDTPSGGDGSTGPTLWVHNFFGDSRFGVKNFPALPAEKKAKKWPYPCLWRLAGDPQDPWGNPPGSARPGEGDWRTPQPPALGGTTSKKSRARPGDHETRSPPPVGRGRGAGAAAGAGGRGPAWCPAAARSMPASGPEGGRGTPVGRISLDDTPLWKFWESFDFFKIFQKSEDLKISIFLNVFLKVGTFRKCCDQTKIVQNALESKPAKGAVFGVGPLYNGHYSGCGITRKSKYL